MQTENGTKYRIRYGYICTGPQKNKRTKKNVLVTVQDREMVFFGISRCKLREDVFTKKGRDQALERALSQVGKDDGTICHIDRFGTSGWCHVKHIKTLLCYFSILDI